MMSQLHLSLLGEPIVKHGEDTLTFSTRKALALLVYLAVEVELTRAKHCPNRSGRSWTPSTDAQPYGLPCSCCASSLSAVMDQASRLTCKSDAIRLDSRRTAHSSWTFALSNLPASR